MGKIVPDGGSNDAAPRLFGQKRRRAGWRGIAVAHRYACTCQLTNHDHPNVAEPDLLTGLKIQSFCLRRKLATRIKELQVALEADVSPNTGAAGGTGYAEDTVGDQEEQSKGSQAMHASHATTSRLHHHLSAVLRDLDTATAKAPALEELLRARQHVAELLSTPYVLSRPMMDAGDAGTDDAAVSGATDTATATLPQTPLLPYVPTLAAAKVIGAVVVDTSLLLLQRYISGPHRTHPKPDGSKTWPWWPQHPQMLPEMPCSRSRSHAACWWPRVPVQAPNADAAQGACSDASAHGVN